MTIYQIDVAIRIGAVSILLLLAWLLLSHREQRGLPAVLFLFLAICSTGFILGNTPFPALRPSGLLEGLAHAASGFTVIFLWWFSLSCFDSRFKLSGGVLVVGLVWAGIAVVDRGLIGDTFMAEKLSPVLVSLGFAIVGHLVWRLLNERQGDLIQQRHDARIMVAVLLGGILFIDLSADTLFGFSWKPFAFAMAQNAMFLGFGIWLAGKLLIVRDDALTFGVAGGAVPPAEIAPRSSVSPENELYRRLSVLIETERVFLDPKMTFSSFVERMGAPERTVRTLVNQELGYDHFRNFLNYHRVGEARRLLLDRAREEKLISIALDSGFASLASFNRAFRAIEGCTPSEFRAAADDVGHDRCGIKKADF